MAVVRIEDCRSLGYCKEGVLQFIARYGLSKSKLVKEGYPEEELSGIDSAFIMKIVNTARQREKENGIVRR